jgi:hypothetical protein
MNPANVELIDSRYRDLGRPVIITNGLFSGIRIEEPSQTDSVMGSFRAQQLTTEILAPGVYLAAVLVSPSNFEPFFSVKSPGTGLGLAVAHHSARHHTDSLRLPTKSPQQFHVRLTSPRDAV